MRAAERKIWIGLAELQDLVHKDREERSAFAAVAATFLELAAALELLAQSNDELL